MCTDFMPTTKKKVQGYKIIWIDSAGHYRSITTGNKYPSAGRRMPVWKTQRNRPCGMMKDTILDKYNMFYRKAMEGRTAAFTSLYGVSATLGAVGDYDKVHLKMTDGTLAIVHVELTDDLLNAEYQCKDVYCGRKIHFLNVVATMEYDEEEEKYYWEEPDDT